MEHSHDMLKRICIFFGDYATYLLGCGANCTRISKNVNRMADRFGVKVDMLMLATHCVITVWDSEHGHSYHESRSQMKVPLSFAANTNLSKLSWDVYEGKTDLDGAIEQFKRITSEKRIPTWVVMVLVSIANASFCRLFGGDFTSMGIVALATWVGYYLKVALLTAGVDARLMFIACSFISSVIGASAYIFHLGGTPDLALGTSVLYLVPGVHYINSVSDLLDGHYLTAFSRFMMASVLTVCLSLGLTGGILLMNLSIF